MSSADADPIHYNIHDGAVKKRGEGEDEDEEDLKMMMLVDDDEVDGKDMKTSSAGAEEERKSTILPPQAQPQAQESIHTAIVPSKPQSIPPILQNLPIRPITPSIPSVVAVVAADAIGKDAPTVAAAQVQSLTSATTSKPDNTSQSIQTAASIPAIAATATSTPSNEAGPSTSSTMKTASSQGPSTIPPPQQAQQAQQAQEQPKRRVTRSTAADSKERKRKAASDSGVGAANNEDDDIPLLPPTATLLFTTCPPNKMMTFQAPPLPITLQALIEVPEFRVLGEGEVPLGRLRIQPNSGQQVDFSDEYYLKRHLQGGALERKGRKQERDRLIIERNRIKHQIEQLRLEVASVSFYANASPIKGSSSSSSSSAAAAAAATSAATGSAGTAAATVGGEHRQQNSRQSTPVVVSERLKESERNKRRQLQEAEDTLRRYDELLQPREPYIPFGEGNLKMNGQRVGSAPPNATAPRTWLTGGKGIPPAPEGISPTEFLNGPRTAPVIEKSSSQTSNISNATQRGATSQIAAQGKGSAIVAQRRLAEVDAGNSSFASTSSSYGGGTTRNASATAAGGRTTRSRSSSPAIMLAPMTTGAASASVLTTGKSASTAPAANIAGSSGPSGSPSSSQRFVPILPKPSTSGSFIPANRRPQLEGSFTADSTDVLHSPPKAGPSSITLKIKPSSSITASTQDNLYGNNAADARFPIASTSSPVGSSHYSQDEPLASRRRTRALQPIDISLSRDNNNNNGSLSSAHYNSLKRDAPDRAALDSAVYRNPLGTGQIRPRKKRKRRQHKYGDSSGDDGAAEAIAEMEASREFIEEQVNEVAYVKAMQSSFATSFDHSQPLGTPDDPDDADAETEPKSKNKETDRPVELPRARTTSLSSGKRVARQPRSPHKEHVATPPKISSPVRPQFVEVPTVTMVTEELTDLSEIDNTFDPSSIVDLPPPPPLPPVLPSIHIERASSASVSTDEPTRRTATRVASNRGSTPAMSSNRKRKPRQLFNKPERPLDTLAPMSRAGTPSSSHGRRARSPLPGRSITAGDLQLTSTPNKLLSAAEKAALTFDSEGDLSSLPSDSDDGGDPSEFLDSETRFRSERATYKLETTDAAAPAFLSTKPGLFSSHAASSDPLETVDNSDASNKLLNGLIDTSAALNGNKRRSTRDSSNASGAGGTQATVGGIKTRRRASLDDFPVMDLNEISEEDMATLRAAYQQVAVRKRETMGSRYLEMPMGDWQVHIPESDMRGS